MRFYLNTLDHIPSGITNLYEKELVVPCNEKMNTAITIYPTWTDVNNGQIEEMCNLIGLTKIAIVILDIDDLFIKSQYTTPYSLTRVGENLALTKEGRIIVKEFKDYLTEKYLFKELIYKPEQIVFGQLNSGLIY